MSLRKGSRPVHHLNLPKRYFFSDKPLPQKYSELETLYGEFDAYQKKHYKTLSLKCLCGVNNSYLVSTISRTGYEYPLVLCESCGLIRAKEYWDMESTIDFYKNWYRKLYDHGVFNDPNKLFCSQTQNSKNVYDFTEDFIKKKWTGQQYTVVDIGGGVGGVLGRYQKEANCYLFDYDKSLIQFARDKGIESVYGSIEELRKKQIKPDLVILSHVIEHFIDVHAALETLKSTIKSGTLVYVALPGIDSLKTRRRSYDFLGDIHRPHVFYFSTETLNNLLSRHGFKCLKSTTEIRALYEYQGNKGILINYHNNVVSHVKAAEFKRRIGYPTRKLVSRVVPSYLRTKIRMLLGQ